MRIDAENRYSDGQELSASGRSTNVIDHGVAVPTLGAGEPMCVVLNLPIAPDSAQADETYTAKLQTDDNEACSSATDIAPTITIPRSAAAGTVYIIPIALNAVLERYTCVYYTLGGSSPVLTIDAYLLPLSLVQNNKVYADAITIS